MEGAFAIVTYEPFLSMSSSAGLKELFQKYGNDFELDPSKAETFYKIVGEKYDGDLRLALKQAIDYFIIYEKSPGLKNVSETMKEIEGKISEIRNMNYELSGALRTLNEKAERIRKLKDDQEKRASQNPPHDNLPNA